ncbi:TerD family protein [Chitinophaga barathri]|uniref:Prokaryotic RING finger family 4 n=1 Tax=Chitinophaga barathri TaxID=1647451 RepID=A0A3N4MP62_9BACT|nr:TerD family protein [Chitinophaga barathri]RPD41459.1 hypothetical protein EG028_09065 [Chitinophaga barathri]
MKTNLLSAAIRYNAVYMDAAFVQPQKEITHVAGTFISNLTRLGYTVDEPLLHALNGLNPTRLMAIYDEFCRVLQLKHNWAPLVKGWNIPTYESRQDHWYTFFANLYGKDQKNALACGHVIPAGTFPLDRYNGCPFCGTPFEKASVEHFGQGSKLKVLTLWTLEEMNGLLRDLLTSKTALDATQADTLRVLLKELDLPQAEISMKETLMLVISGLADAGKAGEAGKLMTSPADILRYLWFRKTGFLQLIEPRTIVARTSRNNRHLLAGAGKSRQAAVESKTKLRLKYSRAEGKMVAKWLSELPLPVNMVCEIMHPRRNMWVRFIRALRLAEYSRVKGFEKLREIMDVFYNQTYEVWSGRVNEYRLKTDAASTFYLLKQRPGLFARSLFSNMLWFGPEATMKEFREVAGKLPARLLLTLQSYAANYFDPAQYRTVKPLGGVSKTVKPHPLLSIYTKDELREAAVMTGKVCLEVMEARFREQENTNKTIFIDEGLYNIPLSIGDRSDHVQDLGAALMGTRFPVEGNSVRLFMQWGKDLPAQHLDMDLSCRVIGNDWTDICAFNRLVATGTKHSGDIRSIPHKTGTAEYIDIDLDELDNADARYVVFTCNAYSNGSITPNLVLGWMNSAYPMKISEKTGVAYDPSCVQHQVRITQPLAKGLAFGVLDVRNRYIVWLEMPFDGQLVGDMNYTSVGNLLVKLNAKISIGQLLRIKAMAQQLEAVKTAEEADEIYTLQWAMNTATVTKLLLD